MSESTPEDTGTPDTGEESGYAVYDETLGRFTTGVLETKAEADKVRKNGPEGHTLTTRKV